MIHAEKALARVGSRGRSSRSKRLHTSRKGEEIAGRGGEGGWRRWSGTNERERHDVFLERSKHS